MKEPAKNINVFEDLIDELKEANLIEETVVETSKATAKNASRRPATAKNKENSPVKENEKEQIYEAAELMTEPLSPETAELLPVEIVAEEDLSADESESVANAEKDKAEELEFYRKQALEEVAFLQMVESAFAGIERDQLKIVPTLYDDLEVKKVLHSYLQALPKASTQERSQEEFKLMQATENWYSSLAARDGRMMAAHLRRYCESSRPPLSPLALLALARFYRNAPYSETIRSKFDLMMTRIFSHEENDGRRESDFDRAQLISHVKELYAEWSSVPLYSTEADDEGIARTVAQFEEFAKEAAAVENFDALITGNFFNRLRQFKEGTNEDFYAPPVVAAAVETNVRIGNRYIVLLDREKTREGIEAVENRYGLVNDRDVSETMSKSMSLAELLNPKKNQPEPEEEPAAVVKEPIAPPVVLTAEEIAIEKNAAYAKWIFTLVGAFVLAALIYFALGFFSAPPDTASAPSFNIENSTLKNYVQSAQLEDGVLKAVVLPEWKNMSGEARKEALKTMLSFGGEKGYRSIELFDENHQKVAVADGGNLSVIE